MTGMFKVCVSILDYGSAHVWSVFQHLAARVVTFLNSFQVKSRHHYSEGSFLS